MRNLDFGRVAPVFYLADCDSTNTRLKALARQGVAEGTALLAGRQSGGRGRLGRSFCSPEGGVYLSVLFKPRLSPERLPEMSALAALAVRTALRRVCKQEAQIKWPNDLLMQGKKICGILPESIAVGGEQAVVLGIGLNLNTAREALPTELWAMATSVSELCGEEFDRIELARCIIEELDAAYSRWLSGESFAAEYRAACINLGRELSIVRGEKSIPALALDVGEDMSLLVHYEDGSEENIRFGEVFVRGIY